jgi:hypothetical protein
LRDSAIDEELDSRDIAGFVRCEEGNNLRDLVRISQPAQRNILSEFLLQLDERIDYPALSQTASF